MASSQAPYGRILVPFPSIHLRLCSIIPFSYGVRNELFVRDKKKKQKHLQNRNPSLSDGQGFTLQALVTEKQCSPVLLTHKPPSLPSATGNVELLSMNAGENCKYPIVKSRLSTLLHTNLFYYLCYSDRIVFCNLVQIKKLGDKTH